LLSLWLNLDKKIDKIGYMEYKLIRQNRKSLKIKITKDFKLEVYAPKYCEDFVIKNFILKHEKWIYKNLYLKKQEFDSKADYYNLNKIYLLGESFDVIKLEKGFLFGQYLYTTRSKEVKNAFKNFLTEFANEFLVNKIKEISNKIQINYKSISIINSKSKWGSCDNLENIRLNLKLIMLPNDLIEYVICHELCHTIELNHSKKFWNLLKKFGYEKKNVRNKLKYYNFLISLF